MNPNLALVLIAGTLIGATSALAQPAARAAAQPAPEIVRYDGHRSVRVTVRTPRELMTVLALTDDVLTCEGAGIGTFDVRFSPEQWAAFLETNIPHEVLIEDLQAHIDNWWAENNAARAADGGWYDAFRDLDEIETLIDDLAAAYPTLVTLSTIGQSIEGRPIRMMRITGPGSTAERPAIVINGTQHSRESLSPMTTMYFAQQLLEQYATDPRTAAIVNGIDFHIVPMVNPDGYNIVWTSNAMWRKNRRVVTGSSCMGVDLNRNWGYQWGNNNGSSSNPCQETYRGESAFSEPETQAISGVVNTLAGQGRMRAHIDVHSYGTLLLSPWGWSTSAPPHLPTMDHLGNIMSEAIETSRGTTYPYGPGSILLYIVSGGSRDYSYGQHGAMGWTIELPGTSFHPSPTQILPVAIETRLGFLSLAEFFLPPSQIFTIQEPSAASTTQTTPVIFAVSNAETSTIRLHWRFGSSGNFSEATASLISADYYNAFLPAAPCGTQIEYYISAQRSGITTFYPAGGPAEPLSVTAYQVAAAFESDIETPASAAEWTVFNDPSLTSGAWERADPIGATQSGNLAAPNTAPQGDFAFVTQNGQPGGGAGAADVDGGPTILTSPTIDVANSVHARLSFDFWHYSVGGNTEDMEVEFSGDNGQSWQPAASYPGSSGWRPAALDIPASLRTSEFRVRFISTDNPNDSVVEAGLDNVRVETWSCSGPAPCYANCDQSTVAPVLNVDDFTCFINNFALAQALPHAQQVTHYANCDSSTIAPALNVDDFTCFINEFAAGCP